MMKRYCTWENFGVVKIDEWANPNQLDGKNVGRWATFIATTDYKMK